MTLNDALIIFFSYIKCEDKWIKEKCKFLELEIKTNLLRLISMLVSIKLLNICLLFSAK